MFIRFLCALNFDHFFFLTFLVLAFIRIAFARNRWPFEEIGIVVCDVLVIPLGNIQIAVVSARKLALNQNTPDAMNVPMNRLVCFRLYAAFFMFQSIVQNESFVNIRIDINLFNSFFWTDLTFFKCLFLLGRHPNCKCEKEGYAYDDYLRYCGKLCDDGFSIYPNCVCESFYKHFLDKNTLKCMPFGYADRPCPPNAVGKSPDCRCLQEYHFFIPYGWGCFNEYAMGNATISCKDSKCRQFVTSNGVEPKAFLQIFW